MIWAVGLLVAVALVVLAAVVLDLRERRRRRRYRKDRPAADMMRDAREMRRDADAVRSMRGQVDDVSWMGPFRSGRSWRP